MDNTINLTSDQIKGLLLLCGHDASHDFFQSKPTSWATLQSGGSPPGQKLVRTGTRIGNEKDVEDVSDNQLTDELGDICYQCDEVSFLDNELNELGNDLNIYEYFSKNIGEMKELAELIEEETSLSIDSTESWIYGIDMIGTKRNVLESRDPPSTENPSKRPRISSTGYSDSGIKGGSPSGSRRIRSHSAIKQKQIDEIKKKKKKKRKKKKKKKKKKTK